MNSDHYKMEFATQRFLQIGIFRYRYHRCDAPLPRYFDGSMGTPPAGASSGGFLVMSMLPVLFDLNFIGYMVLVTALYLPVLQRFQRLTRWALIGYTALTVFLWYIIASRPRHGDYINKAVEGGTYRLLANEDRLPHLHTPRNTQPQKRNDSPLLGPVVTLRSLAAYIALDLQPLAEILTKGEQVSDEPFSCFSVGSYREGKQERHSSMSYCFSLCSSLILRISDA